MAGCLAMVTSNAHLDCHSTTAIGDQWRDIHFSRFFSLPDPSISSTCPSLVPIRHSSRPHGTWISTSSPIASLHITADVPNSDAILTVCFREKILEEHYVSKLHFSWPQTLCVPGYPARGSRTLFISYIDSVGKIQKFALRFSTICEAETFVNALKEILKHEAEPEAQNCDLPSEISFQSEFMSSNGLPSRACEEEISNMAHVDAYAPEMPPNLNDEAGHQPFCTQEIMRNLPSEGRSQAFPPSFSSLLASFCPEAKQDSAQPAVSEEVDLKSQILKYMEDSSFQDMLKKVEKIFNEMGEDFVL